MNEEKKKVEPVKIVEEKKTLIPQPLEKAK
jgi:hypothetical protein